MRFLPISIVFAVVALGSAAAEVRRPVDWVDPLIDTVQSRWFYFNSASRPFGMVNLSPDTQTEGSWKSGYLYGDRHIRCFSHLHGWQLAGVPVMPITGAMTGPQGMDAYQSAFSHDDEVVRPGYHKVVLQRYGITAELTSTTRVGFHRYTFPTTDEAWVLFDFSGVLAHGPVVGAEVRQVSATEIEGVAVMQGTRRRKRDLPVHFVAQLSQPITSFGGWRGGQTLPVGEKVWGRDSGAFLRLETKADEPVMMKVAISYTSIAGARRNLDAELDHWDFDQVVRESAEDWNACLSRIEVEGGTPARMTKFYTDLWRSLLGRRIVSDVDGHYLDLTGEEPGVRRVPLDDAGAPAFRMYNFDAKWGSHWSLNVLWPLLCPERYSEFCQTMVQMYRDGGLIPRGPSGGNYTFVMIGDSAAPFITSAYAKGIRDFDAQTALEGLVRNTQADGGRYYGGYAREPSQRTHDAYTTQGYVAKGQGLKGSHGSSVSSFTLYCAYHDWCIAHLARRLGRHDLYEQFIQGAANYRHVIWPEKRCAWVRLKDGGWQDGFRPTAEGFTQAGFCETSAAISTFYVPHDPQGLAELLGGPAAAAAQLEAQFEAAASHQFFFKGRGHARAQVDYANQDSTGMAHYFNRIGYPGQTQKWARAVLDEAFSGTTPSSGYNGDEDQGQMGSLSALLALGLFQFDGGSGPDPRYDLTAPVFRKITLHLSERYYGGRQVVIECDQDPEDLPYLHAASWDGTPLAERLLSHEALTSGGVLRLQLGAEPVAK